MAARRRNGRGNAHNGLRFEPRLSLDNLILLLGVVGAVVVFWANEKAAETRLVERTEAMQTLIRANHESALRQFALLRESIGKLENRVRDVEIRLGPSGERGSR